MPDSGPLIEVAVDASYCHETRVGAWAVVIAREGLPQPLLNGAVSRAGDNNALEFAALVRGVELLVEYKIVPAGQKVRIYFDSEFVEHRIKHKGSARARRRHERRMARGWLWNGVPGKDTPPGTKPANSPLSRLLSVIATHELNVELVRVRGHSPERMREASSALQLMAKADQYSRRLMRAERKSLLGMAQR